MTRVGTGSGRIIHDVAVVADDGGAAVLWSDGGGLHVRRLEAEGAPRADAVRLGAACPGGVAAAPGRSGPILGCLRPGDGDRGRPGRVAVARLAGDELAPVGHAGPVGEASRGIALTVDGRRAGRVGWQHAEPFTAEAWMAGFDTEAGLDEPRRLSAEGVSASAPTFAQRDGPPIVAWSEAWSAPDGAVTGNLHVSGGQGPSVAALPLAYLDSKPAITADDRGWLTAFLDRRGDHGLRFFVARLGPDLRAVAGSLESPGTAHAYSHRPGLLPCGEHLFAVGTRGMNRERVAVYIARLDPTDLEATGRQHLIYRRWVAFAEVDVACIGGHPLLVVAERRRRDTPRPAVRALRIRCGPGLTHERTPALSRGEPRDIEDGL